MYIFRGDNENVSLQPFGTLSYSMLALICLSLSLSVCLSVCLCLFAGGILSVVHTYTHTVALE